MEAQWKANVCGSEWKGSHKKRTENKKEKHFSSLSSNGSNVIDEGTLLPIQLNQKLLCQALFVVLSKSKCKEIAQISAYLKRAGEASESFELIAGRSNTFIKFSVIS